MANGRLSFIGQGGPGLLAGTTQTPVPGTAGQAGDPSAALVQELLTRLSGGRPQPPQRPGTARSIVGALGDALLAAGAARLGQTTQTPGPFIRGVQQRQTEFAERESEFEEQRIRTLQALASLQARTEQQDVMNRLRELSVELQARRTNRPTPREFVRDVGGQPRRIRQLLDPTGEIVDELDLGPAFVPPAVVPGVPQGGQPTLGTVSRPTGEFQPVTGPGGVPVAPIPPPGIVTDIAAGTATLQGLETLRAAYKEIREKTAGQTLPGQVGRMFIGETRLGGALVPDYAKYVADRRAALNAYIKSVTGAQFSVRELERYEGQYPEPFDPEDVAERKIQALAQRALTDMQVKLRAFPAAAPSGTPTPASTTDDATRILEDVKRELGGTP